MLRMDSALIMALVFILRDLHRTSCLKPFHAGGPAGRRAAQIPEVNPAASTESQRQPAPICVRHQEAGEGILVM